MSPFEKYLRPRPRLPVVAWLLPALMLAAAVVLTSFCLSAFERLVALGTSNAELSAAQTVKPAPRARSSDIELQNRWAGMVLERDFPWRRVFDAVERADRATIELLEFKPDKRTGRIVLRGEARDAESLTAYLEALTSDPSFVHVHLVHRKALVHPKFKTVGFEIKALVRTH